MPNVCRQSEEPPVRPTYASQQLSAGIDVKRLASPPEAGIVQTCTPRPSLAEGDLPGVGREDRDSRADCLGAGVSVRTLPKEGRLNIS